MIQLLYNLILLFLFDFSIPVIIILCFFLNFHFFISLLRIKFSRYQLFILNIKYKKKIKNY